MSQTLVGLNDAKSVKRWSSNLAIDTARHSYFVRKFVSKGANGVVSTPIQQKDELENDAGEQISFDLSMQLRGAPVLGDDRALGKQENLRFYTDTIYIDQMRKPVSAGGKMSRKRTLNDLRAIAKARASDWWGRVWDELFQMYLSGARGVNPDYVFDTSFTGFANNPLNAPDTDHQMYGGVATSKASLAATDKFSRALVERAVTRAAMLNVINTDNVRLQPLNIDGEDHYVIVMSEYQAYDLRVSTSANDWMDVQKAAAAAEARTNPIFKGALGMLNNVVLQKHEGTVLFSDYGAGANVAASRALFMGAQAGVIAFGSSGGQRFDWHEEQIDLGNEPIISTSCIFGIKKTRFNSRDFGVISLDTAAANPN